MKITPKTGPALASANNSASAQRAEAAKARAVAMLTGAPSPTSQNAVSPEEASSVTPSIQKDIPVEATESVAAPEVPVNDPRPASEPVSPQLALLARKEKAIRMEAQKVKAEREAMKARESELEKGYASKLAEAEKSWKSKLLEDPISLMNETGLSYDQLTEKLLNAPKQEDMARDSYIKKLESRLMDLEEKHNKQAKSYEDNQASQYKQALNQIKLDATSLIDNDPEFETIKETGSIDDVVDLIEKTFKADGVLLTVEEAARAVEDHLVEEYLKLSKISKLSKKLQPPVAKEDPSKPLAESSKQQQPGKTLTNNMGSSRALTPRERAILAFEGKLKS